MKSDAGYDPFADFMPVTELVGIPLGLIAHPSFPANNVAELIALAKKTPGGINYSSGGPGSPQHVGMELFVRAAGIQMTHVPHRGATEAVTAIVSGSVPLGITGMSAVIPLMADKRVKLLAVTTAQRLPQLPDAPAISGDGAGLCLQRLVRVHGAGQDAARDCGQAQRRGPCRDQRSGGEEAADRARLRRDAGLAGQLRPTCNRNTPGPAIRSATRIRNSMPAIPATTLLSCQGRRTCERSSRLQDD